MSSASGTHWQKRRCLVAGGFGLIGAALVRALHALGADVCVVDANLDDSGANAAQLADIASDLAIHQIDVRDQERMAQLIRGQQAVFSLVGLPGHLASFANANVDLNNNLLAPIALLESYASLAPEVPLVFASSRQVYGRPLRLPVDETHPCEPLDINAVHRLTAELYHRRFAQLRNLPIRILRLGNIIGPGLRRSDGRQSFLGAWIAALEAAKPFEVWDGSQEREILDVDDAVAAFLLACAPQIPCGRIYNIAGDTPITLLALARRVVALFGRGEFSSREMSAESLTIEIGSFRTNIARAKAELGWVPRVDLNSTLSRALKGFAS
jgi:UDP-glucose 4-epimerase